MVFIGCCIFLTEFIENVMKKIFAINLRNTVYDDASIFKILFTCTRMKLGLRNYSAALSEDHYSISNLGFALSVDRS